MLARLTAGVLLVTSLGCQQSAEEQTPKRPAPPKVNLPPSPEMVEPRFVEKYADGSYTVAGLIGKQTELINREVQVKGFVQEIHRCPEAEAPCDPPAHAVLVDDLARARQRLVVLGDESTRFSQLQQGEASVLEGFYRQSDPDGLFVRMEGLLVLNAEPQPEEPGTDTTDGTDATDGTDETGAQEPSDDTEGSE